MQIAWRDGLDEVLLMPVEHENFEAFCKFTQNQCKYREDKNSAPYFIRGGELSTNYRKDDNLLSSELIALDIDSKDYKNPSPQIVHAYLLSENLTHFIYTTTSHSDEHPSYRVVLPHYTPIKEQCRNATSYLLDLLKPTEIQADPVSFVWSQRWYVSSAKETGTWYHKGNKIQIPIEYKPPIQKENASIGGVTDGMSIAEINEQSKQGHEHGPSRSLAMKLANYGIPFEEALALMAPYPEHHDGHHKQSLETAYAKVESEKLNKASIGSPPPKDDKVDYLTPVFPENPMEGWPEPWPMMWEEYKKIPRVLDECLLLPTILSVSSFLLGSRCLTGRGRRPNMAFLSIASSTAHKDVNSKNVIYDVYEELVKNGVNLKFSKMINGHSSITSDTAFIESFDDEGELFWINTEATHIFHQMAQSGNNAAVKAIESKIIEVVDGMNIQGKKKAGKENLIKGIENPNCQILLYTQPETIAAYVKPTTVDSGLLGRMIISIPKKRKNVFNDMFMVEDDSPEKTLKPEFLNLIAKLSETSAITKKYAIPENGVEKLIDWSVNHLQPMARGEEAAEKMLLRLGISTEQLYAIVMGVTNKWEKDQDLERSKEFDISVLMPLLNYWAECKMYSLGEFVNTSADPLADAVLDVISDCIKKPNKIQEKQRKFSVKTKCVPFSAILKELKKKKKLMRELESRNNINDLQLKVSRIIKTMIENGMLIEVKNGERSNAAKFYGFSEGN